MNRAIFVFGSNLGGHHGAGAAAVAVRQYGAVMGRSYGHYGQSFAIPTKDHSFRNTLSLDLIQGFVTGFLAYAYAQPQMQFQVTRIGCGLAGLTDLAVAPMFEGATPNCWFDNQWQGLLGTSMKYWGTFEA
jgi:hypothetical protein